MIYPRLTIQKAKTLRERGMTYGEITKKLKLPISKSTLSYWCKNIRLTESYYTKLKQININNLTEARKKAVVASALKRKLMINSFLESNKSTANLIEDKNIAKISLAMLCLGEASKSSKKTSFYFGNSDSAIIVIFLALLKKCFDFDVKKIRCTLQCRADQDITSLESYWMKVTNLPHGLFYKAKIDPRTVGKPTKNKNYKGVLRIDYFDNKVRLELECLARLIYEELSLKGR